jgi:hypothetical protein
MPRVTGAVVQAGNGIPLVGVSIALGHALAVSDVNGHFELPAPDGHYDVLVASADKSVVSVYVAVTRRDLLLPQADAKARTRAHHAQLGGTVSAIGGELTTDTVQIAFSSNRASASTGVGAGAKRFGPLELSWDGPAQISGQLFALQSPADVSAAKFARLPITLQDGAKLEVDLALTPVPAVHVAGDHFRSTTAPFSPELHYDYRSANGGSLLHGPGPKPPGLAFDAPDLSAVGAVLCAYSSVNDPYFRTSDMHCPSAVDPVSDLVLHAAPKLTAPAPNTAVAAGLSFSWSGVPGAVYVLELRPEHDASAKGPLVRVYTSALSASWPDLSALGIALPQQLNTYEAVVSARGPFATLDDALGPNGLTLLTPKDSWSAQSLEIGLPVRPPLGPEEARCNYLEHSGPDGNIPCGSPTPGNTENGQPWAALTPRNRKLRDYPEFATAIGIHCVMDCAAAAAFDKAYDEYSNTHPGFDRDEPLGPRPAPPPFPGGPKGF